MKKLKKISCIATCLCAFISLICVSSEARPLLFSIIYIISLTTSYFLIHSLKKDKQNSLTKKKKIPKFLLIISTFFRYVFGIYSILCVIALFVDLFEINKFLFMDICGIYSFALLSFVLLHKRKPYDTTSCKQEQPIATAIPAQANGSAADTPLPNQEPVSIRPTTSSEPPQPPVLSNEERAAKLNEAKQKLMDSQNQLNKITASKEAITVKFTDNSYPPEALNSMRQSYNSMQIDNDVRILTDCINIMNSTSNLKTFFSRYEQAMQIAFTLQMARKSGINVKTYITPDYISSLKNSLADHTLEVAYAKELQEINSLKTTSGKRNRIDKFLSFLSEYFDEYEFSDTYSHIISELNMLKLNL